MGKGITVPRPSETPEYSVCIPYINHLSRASPMGCVQSPTPAFNHSHLGPETWQICAKTLLLWVRIGRTKNQRGWGADATWLFLES